MRLRPGTTLAFLCLSAALSFAWYAAWSAKGGSDLNSYQSQVFELHQRLLFAEKENKERSNELNSVLKAIRQVIEEQNNTSTNVQPSTAFTEWKMLHFRNRLPVHLTNIQYYLPHLQEHEDGIQPNIVIGQGRNGVSLVIGIPTVRRVKETYLMNTLSSLFYEMSKEEKENLVIVIFVAEVDSEYVGSIAESIRSTWRSKQILDYTFLMLYAQPKGTFYLQLEDDIIAKPSYSEEIKNFITKQESKDWIFLEFSQLGFIGKLFKSRDIPLIVEFFLMFYQDKPIDWLLDHLLWVKACHPDKSGDHCEKQKSYLRIRYKPSLFQHVGIHSSLPGKIQNLKDKDFEKSSLFKAHPNPPAQVATSLKIYRGFSLEKAYEGVDCFWALAPVAGDYILFQFYQPLKIESYLFKSGNMDHPGDQLLNTTVEILLDDERNLRRMEGKSQIFKNMTQDGFLRIGAFEKGIATGIINPLFGRINAVRLYIHSGSPMWVLLNEVNIYKAIVKKISEVCKNMKIFQAEWKQGHLVVATT
ncbi:hypothetical protein lerEdw1_012228 [Lerista edwardsae]|nr:hypothetical protein lerEdw1_012228 [Lerista edwardsae]